MATPATTSKFTGNAIPVGGVYNGTPPTLNDGDMTPFLFDSAGNLKTTGGSGGASGGTASIDNSTYAAGSTNGTPLMGALDDVGTTAATEDKVAIARITAQRAVHTNLRNNAGAEVGVAAAPLQVSLANTATNSTPVKVDNSGVTQPVSGTVSVNALPAGTNAIGNVGAKDATGAGVPANAFYQGVNAATALPTAATPGNLTGALGDKFGRTVMLPTTTRDLIGTQTTTISNSTTETTIVTAAASVFNDLMLLLFSNTSATATRVDIRDTTAGTILASVYVPAGDMRGFNIGGAAIPQTSVTTNWTAQCSAAVTDLRVYAVYAKNK